MVVDKYKLVCQKEPALLLMLHSANNDLVNRLTQTKRLLIANRYVLELCANLDKDVKGSVDPIKLLGSVEKSLFEYHSGNRT